jgi:hypothetical protein
VIELYAVTREAAAPRPPLRAVACGGLTAVCGPATEREVTPEVLWEHEEVVEELMEQCNLLPFRFGTRVVDEAAAAHAVGARRDELLISLDRVRGAVELAVRARRRAGAGDAPTSSGSKYMDRRARDLGAARLLHEPLAFLARDSVLGGGPDLLRAAYLVDRETTERFVALVRRLQQSHPDLDVLCTGPWPPYSFADAKETT